jgi:hypothetical protein
MTLDYKYVREQVQQPAEAPARLQLQKSCGSRPDLLKQNAEEPERLSTGGDGCRIMIQPALRQTNKRPQGLMNPDCIHVSLAPGDNPRLMPADQS